MSGAVGMSSSACHTSVIKSTFSLGVDIERGHADRQAFVGLVYAVEYFIGTLSRHAVPSNRRCGRTSDLFGSLGGDGSCINCEMGDEHGESQTVGDYKPARVLCFSVLSHRCDCCGATCRWGRDCVSEDVSGRSFEMVWVGCDRGCRDSQLRLTAVSARYERGAYFIVSCVLSVWIAHCLMNILWFSSLER